MGQHLSKKKKKTRVERLDSAKLTRQSMFDATTSTTPRKSVNNAGAAGEGVLTQQEEAPVNVQEVVQEIFQPRAMNFVAV